MKLSAEDTVIGFIHTLCTRVLTLNVVIVPRTKNTANKKKKQEYGK